MNSTENSFGNIYWHNVVSNASNLGINISSLTVNSVFTATQLIVGSAAPGTIPFFEASRAIYGVGASGIIGGGDLSSFAGGTAGALASFAVVGALGVGAGASAPLIIGALVASGVASTAASILVDSLVDAINVYNSQNPSSPINSDLFDSDILNYDHYTDFEDVTLLDPIIIEANDDDLADYYDALGSLLDTLDSLNEQYGTDQTLEDLLGISSVDDAFDFVEEFLGHIGPRFHTVVGTLWEAIVEFRDAYEANKEQLDELEPGLADSIKKLDIALQRLGRASDLTSPLVLDLDGDGVETISLFDNEGTFDFGAENEEIAHGWAAPDDGFLTLDRNGNGTIDDVSELFGSRLVDGFTLLSQLDENHDGVINAEDSKFNQLTIWQDENSDNIS